MTRLSNVSKLALCVLCYALFVNATGFADDTVLFGINVPFSGAYALQGEDELKAYKLAIKALNEKGGILGRKVIYSVKDTETSAAVARQNTRKLIEEGAIMITGGSSSSVAIAQSEECQKAGVVFMATLTHSNDTTGADGHRHTFRWYINGHQTAKAMAQALTQRFGKNARYAFLYVDYTWGQTAQKSMQDAIEKDGAQTVLVQPTKLGSKSFISDLLKARKAKPDVLVLIHFGEDMVNCLKQATQLKLRDDMEIVVPLVELNMCLPLGPEIMQGILASTPWYHSLSEKFEGSRKFVEAFEKEYGIKPGNGAAAAWVNIFQYADAVERAGSFDHIKVIKALEDHRFTLLMGEEYWRGWDHQGIHPTYIVIGKTPEQSKNKWDLFEIVSVHEGDGVARTREENPVVLEPLE